MDEYHSIEPDGYRIYRKLEVQHEHDESSIGMLYLTIALVAVIAGLMYWGLHIIH